MVRGDRTKFRVLIRPLVNIRDKILSLDQNLFQMNMRRKGAIIGNGNLFIGKQVIDMTRPALIQIGNNCVFSYDVTILTHGYDFCVLRSVYGDIVGSSGRVVIEDNVFVGARSIILKGIRIGKNSIIGAGSIVTHDIPPNSVAAGNPCKVIMTLDEYYAKRKQLYLKEAKIFAFTLYKTTGKIPKRTDFLDEFPIFLKRNEMLDLLDRDQLGPAIDWFLCSKPLYDSFEDFLIDSGIPVDAVKAMS